MRARSGLLVLSCLLVLVLVAGCDTGGLNFVQDRRVQVTAPQAYADVTPPVTVSWSVTDFETIPVLDGSRTADRGQFVVFVDRSPIPPGQDLSWLARDDEGCQADPRCPDHAWLEARNVYLTPATSLTLPRLNDHRDEGRGPDTHRVTVVLVDGTSRRVSESAFSVEFNVVHPEETS